MALLYNDTITVFNRVSKDGDFIWYPTIVNNTHVVIDKAAMISNLGENCSDNAMINIRYTINNGDIIVGGKKYIIPKQWNKLLEGQHEDYVTFAFGNDFDFIYAGTLGFSSAITDVDYTDDNGFYNYMRKNYDDVYDITGVSRYKVLPHFQVTAR